MYDEIGIAANRRGEMGIAAQIKAEMPIVLSCVFGLCLCPQNDFIDELLNVSPFHPLQDAIELGSPQRSAFRKGDIKALQKLSQSIYALRIGLVMDAIDQRYAASLEGLCGGKDSDVSLATIKRRLVRAEARFTELARREPSLADWVGDES